MRVVICAAGRGERWKGYLGTRKHLARIDGEPLLRRTVRMLRERGLTDIWITNHHDHPYDIPGATCYESGAPHATTARKMTWPRWQNAAEGDGRTLLILGDVFYSEQTIEIMARPLDGWYQYGRLAPSQATGKCGAEMFGWQFGVRDHHEFVNAIEAVDAARERGETTYSDWSIYAYMTGHPIATPPDQIRDWGRHVEIADDGTDDFDFPDDYERFAQVFLGRSARRVHTADFQQPWLQERTRELARAPKLHRKLWEHCSIAQAYRDRVGECGQVLGFGIGREALPAWFAAQGATVVATDRPEAGVWLERQHARGLDELRRDDVCDDATFRERVSYRPADMRNIPADLRRGEFDLTWSSSCFEHLGSIRAGLDFFCQQMECLKPGGIAVHTTEYNTCSNDKTIETPELSFFRQRDLVDLTNRLRAQGDRLWPIDLTAGARPEDLVIDEPPFQADVHLNLKLGGQTFTSVLLIAARGI